MKKICMLAIVVSLLLIACGEKTQNVVNNDDNFQQIINEYKEPVEETQPSFVGRVVEISDEGDTLVEVINENNKEGQFKDNEIVNIGSTGDALYMSGTNVKITYNGFVRESYPAQIEPLNIELLNSQIGYVKLENLPTDYTTDSAINDGCVVITHNDIYNISVLTSFIEDAEADISSFVRIAKFTIEGDMILTDVKYIKRDNKYYVRHDNTRDKFAAEENRKIEDVEYNKYRKEYTEDETHIFLDNAEGTILIAWYNTDKFIEEKVDRLLTIITNSPNTASNPGTYIEAHQDEYDELIEMDTDALKVMFPRLSKKNASLKEFIELAACRKILGGEDIKLAAETPYDWYIGYKSHILRIYDQNSKEFMDKHSPKASILLDLIQK